MDQNIVLSLILCLICACLSHPHQHHNEREEKQIPPTDIHCNEPESLGSMGISEYTDLMTRQSFSSFPGWQPSKSENIRSIPSEYINKTYEHFFGPLRCNDGSKRQDDFNTINDVSICQMRDVVSSDENRKPEMLLETECVCDDSKIGKHHFSCLGLESYVFVYRRFECSNGVYKYKRVMEAVKVGCKAVQQTPSEALNIERSDYKMEP